MHHEGAQQAHELLRLGQLIGGQLAEYKLVVEIDLCEMMLKQVQDSDDTYRIEQNRLDRCLPRKRLWR